MNRYTYAHNDPVQYVDPSGHFAIFGSLLGNVGKVVSTVKKVVNTVKDKISNTANKVKRRSSSSSSGSSNSSSSSSSSSGGGSDIPEWLDWDRDGKVDSADDHDSFDKNNDNIADWLQEDTDEDWAYDADDGWEDVNSSSGKVSGPTAEDIRDFVNYKSGQTNNAGNEYFNEWGVPNFETFDMIASSVSDLVNTRNHSADNHSKKGLARITSVISDRQKQTNSIVDDFLNTFRVNSRSSEMTASAYKSGQVTIASYQSESSNSNSIFRELFDAFINYYNSQNEERYEGFTTIHYDEMKAAEQQETVTAKEFVTIEQLEHIGWNNVDESMIKELNYTLGEFEITTPERIRHFLAQASHESGAGKWPKELSSGEQYENRDDLGNVNKGDGPKYKGAGYIQLTGRYNYRKFSDHMEDPDIMDGVDYVSEEYPWTSAGFWWDMNNMNDLVDSGATVEEVTRRVNGGTNGLDDRKRYYNLALEVIKD